MANVLMVESSVLDRRRWGNALRAAGHRVLEAASVSEATELLTREGIEMVVCSGRQTNHMLSELAWVAPWMPLICLVGPEGAQPGMERATILLDLPLPAEELAAWVDTELMLQRAVA